MSDISVLSHEYKTASEFFQCINQSLIVLKKAYYSLPGAELIDPHEVSATLQRLGEILITLTSVLDPARSPATNAVSAAPMPAALVAKLRAARQGDLPYYVEDLQTIVMHLSEGVSGLSEADIAILDQLAAAADAETSSVFRRLMRK